MIKFNFYNNYGSIDLKPKKWLKKVVKAVNKLEKLKSKHIVSFILVTDDAIQDINRQYRKLDRPTDVISFANIDSEDYQETPYELGDIFICFDRTIAQAEQYQHSIIREFSFLATHGLFHLLGYDHQNPEDEELMTSKQRQIMKMIGLEKEV